MKRLAIGLALCAVAYAGVVAAIGLSARARPSDLAVVFGNTVAPDGTPSPRLAARLAIAAALWRAGTVRAILVSGAVGREGFDEARVMHDDLVRRGVPDSVLVVDSAGHNTALTCAHARTVLAARHGFRVVLVTQWFHVARALLAARREGLTGLSAQAPRWAEPRDVYSFARELVALPAYALRPPSTAAQPGA